MSNDWQPGDLAECIDDGSCECCGAHQPALALGIIYTVADVVVDDGILLLRLGELPTTPIGDHEDGSWVDALSFRKVRRQRPESVVRRVSRELEAA